MAVDLRQKESAMKQQGNSKERRNRRRQMADTMFEVISMFDSAFGKPAGREGESPEQMRGEVNRLCGVSRGPSSKRKRSE
jgi:hypothetical protein